MTRCPMCEEDVEHTVEVALPGKGATRVCADCYGWALVLGGQKVEGHEVLARAGDEEE